MTTPKPIDPQDIRVGMRVRVAWTKYDAEVTAEFTVGGNDPSKAQIMTAGDGPLQRFGWTPGTWTLLADAPTPQVEPNRADAEDCEACAGLDHPCLYHEGQYAGAALLADVIRAAIGDAQSTDRPAFDPAVLWPPADGLKRCGDECFGYECARPIGHEGEMHAAWDESGRFEYLWGDPR